MGSIQNKHVAPFVRTFNDNFLMIFLSIQELRFVHLWGCLGVIYPPATSRFPLLPSWQTGSCWQTFLLRERWGNVFDFLLNLLRSGTVGSSWLRKSSKSISSIRSSSASMRSVGDPKIISSSSAMEVSRSHLVPYSQAILYDVKLSILVSGQRD